MEATFQAQGFDVLGFLSNDFGDQGGNPGQIDNCNAKYGITYPEFKMDHVVGPSAEPVFKWLEAQPNPGPDPTNGPTWNFSKYLVSRDGKVVGHWDTPVYPGDDPNNPNDSFDTNEIVIAIKAELAKPKP